MIPTLTMNVMPAREALRAIAKLMRERDESAWNDIVEILQQAGYTVPKRVKIEVRK